MTPTTISQQSTFQVADDLKPISASERHIGPMAYVAMWLGDGFNIGNITLGSSIVVAGVATVNLVQTLTAAGIAIVLITLLFTFNDQFGYRTGAPYVIQLRLSFGTEGAKLASLLRGIPAIVWFGFQSWTGALALNQIAQKLFNDHIDRTFAAFLILQVAQIVMAFWGFRSIKRVTSAITVLVTGTMIAVFGILLTQHLDAVQYKLVQPTGTWGLPFFGLIVAFLGNYTAIFESAADYSRELKTNIGHGQRSLLYLLPISLAYGLTIVTGAMLGVVTGISSPVNAMAHLFHGSWASLIISLFIVLGTITTNAVANIMPPTYMLTSLLKIPQWLATTVIGLLAVLTCPWLLVQDSSSAGLALFIHIYSIFLGPMTAIILIEYYVHRRQRVTMPELYDERLIPNATWRAPVALLAGAVAATVLVSVSWFVGFAIGGIVYLLLGKKECGKV